MTYLPLDYLIALGEARSCLAALADSTDDVDLSAHFDRLLIQFDIITGDVGHACSPVAGSRAEILARLEGGGRGAQSRWGRRAQPGVAA